MANERQTIINRMSLIMTIPEDIVKACRENDFSAAMTETLLRIHDQQSQLDTAVNDLRSIQLEMARVVEMQAGIAGHMSNHIQAMSQTIGFSPDELVSSEEVTGD
jgi:hypothetical protein